jgi:CBS domain-containing protein
VLDADGHLAGIVTRGDVLEEETDPDDLVLQRASRDVVAIRPDDRASVALNVILNEGVEHVPVVADGRLVGICTRTDLLKVHRDQRRHEDVQPRSILSSARWPRRR